MLDNEKPVADATVIEVKTQKPTDMAAMMMEKIVTFLNKIWVKPEIIKSLIEDASPKIEQMSKKEETPSMESELKPEEKKPMSLQERLNSMC